MCRSRFYRIRLCDVAGAHQGAKKPGRGCDERSTLDSVIEYHPVVFNFNPCRAHAAISQAQMAA